MRNSEQQSKEEEIPEEVEFAIKQLAQLELMKMAGGESNVADWIKANAQRFDEIFNNKKFNFGARLKDESTHAEALEEIKQKLYY